MKVWWKIFFIFVYWMHDAYMKCIFYRMNNTMKMNSIFFCFFACLNKTLKMHECMRLWGCMNECTGSIWNFFLRMHVCYLHGSTLDENGFYEICMDVWSRSWMYEWMKAPFFQHDENEWTMKIYFLFV